MRTRLAQLLRFGLGALLLIAGALKLRDPSAFATEIANYQLWPRLAPVAAATLPASEVLVGVVLLAGTPRWRRAAGVAAVAMFVVFLGAVTSAALRDIDIACGCFGGGGDVIGPLTVLRNVLLVAAALALLHLDAPPRAFTVGSVVQRQ